MEVAPHDLAMSYLCFKTSGFSEMHWPMFFLNDEFNDDLFVDVCKRYCST